MITLAAPIITTTLEQAIAEHSRACDEALVELDTEKHREGVRDEDDLEVLAIAAATFLEERRQRPEHMRIADLLRALAPRVAHSEAHAAELEAELVALKQHLEHVEAHAAELEAELVALKQHLEASPAELDQVAGEASPAELDRRGP